jgi:putative PIN family toxin of toxin-antitoxin system
MENYKIIIDTNLWVSFLIGKKLSALKELLQNSKLTIYMCDSLIEEIKRVAAKPKIRRYLSEDDSLALLELIGIYCTSVSIKKTAVSSLRDFNDLFLLSLAETVNADFILTGDKDLLVLGSHRKTSIVTYSVFIQFVIQKG